MLRGSAGFRSDADMNFGIIADGGASLQHLAVQLNRAVWVEQKNPQSATTRFSSEGCL